MRTNLRDMSDEDTEPVMTITIHETGYADFLAYISQQRRLAMAARVPTTESGVQPVTVDSTQDDAQR